MAQMQFIGNVSDTIFVVECPNDNKFWIYLKEGHAINRMLKERENGKEARIVRFTKDDSEV